MRYIAILASLMTGACASGTPTAPSPTPPPPELPVYVLIGDSLTVGQGMTPNQLAPSVATDQVFREDGQWAPANDPTDMLTNRGSFWPLVAAALPPGTRFIATAKGSTTLHAHSVTSSGIPLTSWQPEDVNYQAMAAVIRASGVRLDHLTFIGHLGANDVVQAPPPTADSLYADVQTLAGALTRDYPGSTLYLADVGQVWTYGDKTVETAAVRAGIQRAWAEVPGVRPGPQMGDLDPRLTGDGVHYQTDAVTAIIADRWKAALTR